MCLPALQLERNIEECNVEQLIGRIVWVVNILLYFSINFALMGNYKENVIFLVSLSLHLSNAHAPKDIQNSTRNRTRHKRT